MLLVSYHKDKIRNMDINDISKVANRKRMNAEAEKLREKVSRETSKIIKLKVAQDTAYWDLKEKLQQVESNHEKLQQNMVEVQMQHETISGQYQEELRLRPDTLNKLSSTREICDVLEDYSERLKETLSRCKADQAALCEAYQRSGQLVREVKTRQLEEDRNNRRVIEALEEKVKLTTEHQNQLLQFFTLAKQQADAEISNLRNKLDSTSAQRDELMSSLSELNRKLDQCKFEMQKKEEMNANLQTDMKNLMQEINSQASEARNMLTKQDREIREANDEIAALKQAITNQEQFTATICEQKNALQERVAILEDEQVILMKGNDEMKLKIEEILLVNEGLINNVSSLTEEKESLSKEAFDSKQAINNLEQEIQNLKIEYSKLENEKVDLKIELDKAIQDLNNKTNNIEELIAMKQKLEDEATELQAAFNSYKLSSEEKIKELNSTIDARDKEIDSKAATINQLMSELKISTDIRSKLEVTIQKIKKEIEIERDGVKEKERKMTSTIGQLETVVRDKDDELSKQMSIILEMRNEKERLQEKIQSMQNTIDNIQKELTRPPPQPAGHARMQPELDDNAVMLTPSHKKTAQLMPQSPTLPPTEFAKPRSQEPKQLDNMLYTLFSDSSMEGDTLDSSEVNRRFSALERGERVSPMPLSVLKRRGSVPTAQGGLRLKSAANDSPISLSQVKNDMKSKERTFFKNKRAENKTKRTK